MTHLIDLSAAPCGCANHALEALHKAIAEDGSRIDLLWSPHHDPWLRDIIEDSTAEGQAMLQDFQDALFGALGLGPAVPLLRKADPHTGKWTEAEVQAVQKQLAKPLGEYGPDDWLALIDLTVQTRLPAEKIGKMAEKMAWHSHLSARLEAASLLAPGLGPKAAFLSLLGRIRTGPPPAAVEARRGAWAWAKSRIGLHLQGVADSLRNRVSGAILRHIEEHGTATPQKLEQALRDEVGTANRDLRRIAITEAGEAANQAFLSEFPEGSKVKRVEVYAGACPFCRKIDGMVFTWTLEPRGQEDSWTHVWPGKTNIGRSASPRKKTEDGGLELRTPEELWHPAAGLQHPNCRGRWLLVSRPDDPPPVDPDFMAWVKAELAKA